MKVYIFNFDNNLQGMWIELEIITVDKISHTQEEYINCFLTHVESHFTDRHMEG